MVCFGDSTCCGCSVLTVVLCTLSHEERWSVGGQASDYKWYRLHEQDRLGCRVGIDRQKIEERGSCAAFCSKVKFLSIE